jgi:hypothetical protein
MAGETGPDWVPPVSSVDGNVITLAPANNQSQLVELEVTKRSAEFAVKIVELVRELTREIDTLNNAGLIDGDSEKLLGSLRVYKFNLERVIVSLGVSFQSVGADSSSEKSE